MRTATMDEIHRPTITEVLKAVKDALQQKPERALERIGRCVEESQTGSSSARDSARAGAPRGRLRGEDVEAAVLISKSLSAAETEVTRNHAIGDVVRFSRTYWRALEVEAGDDLRVCRVDIKGNTIDEHDRDRAQGRWRR